MNTNKLRINSDISKNPKTLEIQKKHRIKSAKKRKLRIFDEIEEKDILIKKYNSKIKTIKSDSIKELIYTNQNIPKNWRRKPNYKDEIYDLFKKNPKFLLYLGNGYNTYTETRSPKEEKEIQNNNSQAKNNNKENQNDNKNLLSERMKNKIQKLSLSPIAENPMNKKEIQYTNTMPNKNQIIKKKNNSMKPKEILNILDEFQNVYPIKEKLNDLFPKEEIEKINNTQRISHPIINKRIKKQMFKNNICFNLIYTYKDKKSHVEKKVNKNKFPKNTNILKLKKEMIKNPLVLKKLERINFYGPHYSYCSECGNKNIDFYQKLPIKQLNSITNEIRKYRNLI